MPNLLYIEDETDLYEIIRDTFEDLCSVIFAKSLKDADIILKNNEIHYIISDVNLPDGNALQYFEELAEEYEIPPLIFLSGEGELSNKIKSLVLGGVDYFVKPTDPKALRTRIKFLMSESKD